MSERSDALRRRAEECDAAEMRVRDPDVRSAYLDMASRWRRMADQQEQIDTTLGRDRKPTE